MDVPSGVFCLYSPLYFSPAHHVYCWQVETIVHLLPQSCMLLRGAVAGLPININERPEPVTTAVQWKNEFYTLKSLVWTPDRNQRHQPRKLS